MTTSLCVDASVAAKWWLKEPDSDIARLLLDERFRLTAPSLLPIELASVFAHKFRRGQIGLEALNAIVDELGSLPVRLADAGGLIATGVELATRYHPSLYDCLYAALALREDCPVVTADRPFFDALKAPFPETMVWIDDVAALLV